MGASLDHEPAGDALPPPSRSIRLRDLILPLPTAFSHTQSSAAVHIMLGTRTCLPGTLRTHVVWWVSLHRLEFGYRMLLAMSLF